MSPRRGQRFVGVWACLACALTQRLSGESYPVARQAFAGLLESRSPRNLALGGSQAALAEGTAALDEDPAGLARSQGMDLGVGHFQMLQGSALEDFQFSRVWPGVGGYGLGFKYLDQGTFERRDNNGELLPDSFHPWGLGLSGGLAWAMSPRFALGGSLGYLQQSIADQAQSGFQVGIGSHYQASEAWSFAMGLKGLGGRVGQSALPTTGYLASAWRTRLGGGTEFLLVGQAASVLNGIASLGLGAQLGWKHLELRGGYLLPFEETTLNGLQGLGAGLGASYQDFHLDYGLAFQGELGMPQSLTLSYRWSVATPPAAAEAGAPAMRAAAQARETITRNLASLKKNPKDKRLWVETGNLYLGSDRKADANTCFRWALSLDPADDVVKRLFLESR